MTTDASTAAADTRASYDVVIVGGGHNGLVAAAYLARAGRSCLLLERREELGGAAVSAEVFAGLEARLSRYSYLVSLMPSSIIAELGLPVRLARRAVASYTPDPRVGGAPWTAGRRTTARATARSFLAVSGGEAEHRAWEQLYGMTRRDRRRRVADADRAASLPRARCGRWWATGPHGRRCSSGRSPRRCAAPSTTTSSRGVVLTDALIGTFAAAGERSLRQNRCFLYHVIGGEWLVPVGGMGAVTARARARGARRRAQSFARRRGDRHRAASRAARGALHRRHAASAACARGTSWSTRRRRSSSGSSAAPRRRERPEGAQLKLNLLLSRLPRLRDARGRARAGLRRHVPRQRDGRAASARLRAGRRRRDPRHAAVRGLLPLADATRASSARAARGGRAHADGLRSAHARAPVRRRPRGVREMRRSRRRCARSTACSPSRSRRACCAHRTGGRAWRCTAPWIFRTSCECRGGHIFHRDLAWPFAEHEREVGTWGVETEHPAILLCGAGARRGGGVSGIPGRNAAMAVLCQ